MRGIQTVMYLVGCCLLVGIGGAMAAEMSSSNLFSHVDAAYEKLDTYRSQGTIVSDIETSGMHVKTETTFAILLEKPDRYLITWTQKNLTMPGMTQTGAAWSDGSQPYLYIGSMNAYSKMTSDEIALGGATGISGGAAHTIPSLFLAAFDAQPSPFLRLIDPTIQGTEKIGDDDCYVVRGASTISREETFWVSTTSYLIRQHQRSLEPPEGGSVLPEMTDEQIDESIKSMGQKVSEETRKNMREMIKNSHAMMKTMKMTGSSTESHRDITSPELAADDFRFTPEGAELKDSLFGAMFGGTP